MPQAALNLGNGEVLVAQNRKRWADADGSARSISTADDPVRGRPAGASRGHVELLAPAPQRLLEIREQLLGLLAPKVEQLADQLVGIAVGQTAPIGGLADGSGDPFPREHDEPERLEDPVDELLAETGEAVRLKIGQAGGVTGAELARGRAGGSLVPGSIP